ncbi:MAG: aspartyl protease family protein [Bacteroidota bacterium]
MTRTLILLCLLLSTNRVVTLAQSKYETLEVVIMQDQPIVKGTINGKNAYLLLNTGADVSIIHFKDAKRYGFSCHTRTSMKKFRVTGLGANVKGLVGVYNMDLQLGSQIIRANYIALDLSNIINSLNTGTSVRINGIIGSKALKTHGFLIDYHRKEVKLRLLETD